MSDDWKPTLRKSYREDFEDRLDEETVGDGAWALNIPEEVENGQDLTPNYFLLSGIQAEERGDARFEDFNFRKAALRGSWVAMQRLAALRYHLGFLDESMRWNQRLLACLMESSPEEHLPPFGDEDLIDVENNIAFLEAQGVNVAANTPHDLGKNRDYMGEQFTYCLKCGFWKIATAPLAQCDDSVHMVLRRTASGIENVVSKQLADLL